jgi:glutamate synthase (NADPH) large chain
LGVTRLTDLIGRHDLLEELPGITEKQGKVTLAAVLKPVHPPATSALFHKELNPPADKGDLNIKIAEDFKFAVENGTGGAGTYNIHNTDRSVGARLSGIIAGKFGNNGMKNSPVTLQFSGTGGQSFGAWNAGGLQMVLTGDANDYVGKGMAGGKLVVKPPQGVEYRTHEASIIGNTCLYGATGGRLYAAGRAGERFAVRNSGARAVAEGAGDNCCEYMTGGWVTLLGSTGVNFGAGMTGGFAYVLDEDERLDHRINPELVEILVIEENDVLLEHLRGIINRHYRETGSPRAEQILTDFDSYSSLFKLVKPKTTDVATLLGHRGNSPREMLAHTH